MPMNALEKTKYLCETVKSSVTMYQVVEAFGYQINRRGNIICPFHKDTNPSCSIKESFFKCFVCDAKGDAITFVAKLNNCSNREASLTLANMFHIQVDEQLTYRQIRKREIEIKKQRELKKFIDRATLLYKMYWQLLCEASRDYSNPHFDEALQNITYTEYFLDCLNKCPEEIYENKKAVSMVGEIQRRIINWYE